MKKMKLNSVKKQLLKWLVFYRGATPIQLAQIVYKTENPTTSNKKYIYGQLKELAEKGMLKSFSPDPAISPYMVYHLSSKGLEWYQDEQNIEEGDSGTGWVFDESEGTIGCFEYGTHKPPQALLEHHLLGIDVFTILHRHGVKHRNNLYAKRSIQPDMRYKAQTVKPDAEMILNGTPYMIEIDTGSESHEQLVEKFDRYFQYATTYRNENDGVYDAHNIIFVMEGQHNKHTQRRWKNILAAYYKSMRALHDKFTLQLVLLSDFEKFISSEKMKDAHTNALVASLINKYKVTRIATSLDNVYQEVEVSKNGNHTYLCCHTFNTPYHSQSVYILSQFHPLGNNFFNRMGFEPYLPDKFEPYAVDKEILHLYEKAKQCKYKMS